jgi:predicted ATPase
MLTRLKINGFKNLIDTDIRFGAFTCIAGANGSGKSNLFDAIRFLSALADKPLLDAALSIRDESGRSGDVRSIFTKIGNDILPDMSFEVEIIIPREGVDDLGKGAIASSTFVRYRLELRYRGESDLPIEIIHESLESIDTTNINQYLLFPQSIDSWQKNAILRPEKIYSYIYTRIISGENEVEVYPEGKDSPLYVLQMKTLPRTILSSRNASESPTSFLTRQEMRSWQVLQLEPSALRQPDTFRAPRHLNYNGAHLPATLVRIAKESGDPERLYCQLTNRLAEIISDIRDIRIDTDEKRELYTLLLKDRSGTTHTARALSDGTLRFLALATIWCDPKAIGVFCLEEPENGIHPERIPAILDLLKDIAVDTEESLEDGNPLRQVIINTHSPDIIQGISTEDLLGIQTTEAIVNRHRIRTPVFCAVKDTWRTKNTEQGIYLSHHALLTYLNPQHKWEKESLI